MWELRDELWEVIEPLLPAHCPDPRGGRPRVDDRVCFSAIVFVLFAGMTGRLHRNGGASSAARARLFTATAHRRLGEWQRARAFAELHQELLRRLNRAGRIDWQTSVVDGSHIRALQGGLDRAFAG